MGCSSGGTQAITEQQMVAPVCYGFALGCEGRGPEACSFSLGCFENSNACGGFAESCSLLSQYACISQEGCFWDSTNLACSGLATPCDVAASCGLQAGCVLQPTCTGSPTPCDTFPTVSTCETQLGCLWGVPPQGDASTD